MRQELQGYMLIILASIFWGFTGTVARFVFRQEISPIFLVEMRLLLASSMLFAAFGLFDRRRIRVSRRDLPYLAVLGIAGFGMSQFTYLSAIHGTGASTAAFLQSFSPVLVTVYSIGIKREQLGMEMLLALLAVVLGCFLLVSRREGVVLDLRNPGVIAGITCAVFAAFQTVYSKRGTGRINPWTMIAYAFGFGAIFWAFFSPPWKAFSLSYSPGTWLLFLYIALFSTIIPFGLFVSGLKYVHPAKAMVVALTEPLVAAIVAYLVLGETMSGIQIIGGALMLFSVFMVAVREGKRRGVRGEVRVKASTPR